MVDPTELKRFKLFLKIFGISNEVFIPNVQRLVELYIIQAKFIIEIRKFFSLIDNETEANVRASSTFGWTQYHNLAEIEAWLDGILETYPEVTEGFIIGKSYEGRNIRGLKISYKSGNPGVFIESQIHSNEWITSATCTWFINQLLSSEDKVVRNIAENNDWYIVPVLNVDGFVYSHEKVSLT